MDDDPHVEVEIKPQLKPRGSMAEERDPNLPTSCTSCILNPRDQLGRAPTKENTLALIAVDIGGKNTQE